ncbi:MAG: hypothetical protein ACR2QW_02505 [bacterium]
MSEKQKIIQEMLKMQKQFIAREHKGGIEPEEYYDEEGDSVLSGYQEKYNELANQLVDMAHQEQGSRR